VTSEILRKIRQALDTGPIAKAELPAGFQPEQARLVETDLGPRDLTQLFAERAESSGAGVHLLDSPEMLGPTVARILPENARVAVSDLSAINKRLQGDLVSLLAGVNSVTMADELDDDEIFQIDAAVTPVDFAIAETGSIVVSSGPQRLRMVSLVPEMHVALIWREQIASDLMDLGEKLMKTYQDSLPAGMTIISGPSKTADIEMNLVIGVHGPGQLHLIVL